VEKPDPTDARRFRVSGSFSIRTRRGQPRRRSRWYQTYVGRNGILLLGAGVYILILGDYRVGGLVALSGGTAILYAVDFVRRCSHGESDPR
jgi:hypothetical protein